MASKKVGTLVKEARTAADLTQEKLAKAAGEKLTAAMISKCERGEADLTKAQLKRIAVVCGVTQSSLINAPQNLSESKAAASSKSSATEKKTASKASSKSSATEKKTASKASSKSTSSKKTSSGSATSSVKLTAAEKKFLEAYREASADSKKIALKVLKGEYGEKLSSLLSGSSESSAISDGISNVLGDVLSGLLGGK